MNTAPPKRGAFAYQGRCKMPPTVTLRIVDNADRQLAQLEVPVPLSVEPGECAMFDAERFETLLDRGCRAMRKVFDDDCQK